MTACLNGEFEDVFRWFTGYVSSFWQQEVCVEKSVGLKYARKRTRKGGKDNKGRRTISSCYTRYLCNPAVLFGWMAVRLDWKVCGNALMHARLCKIFSGSAYCLPQQLIGKLPIPISKIYVWLYEWKTHMNTLLMLGYFVGERIS